jgi:hypothetical protein
MDDNEFDLDLDTDNGSNDRINKRITNLTEKAKTEAIARAQAETKAAEAEARASAAEKKGEFYSAFSDMTSKYPEASNYKDAIEEKVMAGYTAEDATVSILAKEGKLHNYTPPARMDSPAGGSATTAMRNDSDKSLSEMSREDKRNELLRMEQEGGGLSNLLRRQN